jgi:intracellular septation protein
MKLLFDLFPILLFFAAFKLADIYVATGVAIGLFAAALLLAPRLTGKNPLRAIMGAQLSLPPRIWQRLTWAWAGFFAAMGALNLFVAYRFPLETWVDFKVFGTLGLTIVFVIVQAVWIGRHAEEPETGDAGR